MIEWRFLMFLHQVYFYFCRRFRIEFLKKPSSEMLHFNIALQKTSILYVVPGNPTVLRTAKRVLPVRLQISNFNFLFKKQNKGYFFKQKRRKSFLFRTKKTQIVTFS